MNTQLLTEGIRHTKEYGRLYSRMKELREKNTPMPLLVDGVSDGTLYALCHSLIKDINADTKKCVLLVVGEERRANKLNELFKRCGLSSEHYQVRDFNFYDMTASHELEHERLRVLSGLVLGDLDVIIATPDAILQYTMPQKMLRDGCIEIKADSPVELNALKEKLMSMGYSSTEAVESAGQFSVRGGIIDIFPTKCEYKIGKEAYREQKPIRIELFGDEIDRMALFDPMTQRMTQAVDSFRITPSKEIIPTEEKIFLIRELLERLKTETKSENARKELEKELFTLEGGLPCAFLDRFISLIYPEKECLLDYLDKDTTLIFSDTPSVKRRAKESESGQGELVTSMLEEGLIESSFAEYYSSISRLDRFADERICVYIDAFIMSHHKIEGGLYHFSSKGISMATSSIGALTDELKYYSSEGYKSVLVCQTDAEARSCLKTLNELEITSFSGNEKSTLDKIPTGGVCVITDSYPEGYELPADKLAICVLSSRKARDKKKCIKNKALAKNAGEKILSYADLNVGDYVVHVTYGIGKFLGIQNLYVMGAYKDYIAIQYAGTDKLFLPVDQLDLVAKYIGAKSSTGEVKLSKMGGAEWKKSTQRAKTAAKDMAKELIDLYARRTRLNGFAFMPDGLMETEFDSSFEFEETESQLQAISEIKADMERPYPMDRVLCGDVGYGKTEVAFRAAMKAVANNKQVAILVPTTILALQHFQTALSRFAGTGVNIDMISRFRTQKEQAATLRRLRRGDLDIIIGTHKLLSGKVEFKDLGLLIVDEEQRFGVAQKEKIKKIAPDVDVLTLSATPIPRTLSMAMGGIRDLSVLDESPGGRVGVMSYVLEYDQSIINDAIRRELHRGGQVFYLHNNVEDIYSVASKIRTAFPEASLAVAHGQMDKDSIEEIWQALVNGDVDILVSTTIIETGIDIPNANTLIIENADRMGLSQLHQIRGRVGRSHRRAYAFFTYRRGKELSEIAARRLSAIRDFCEFGAGFKIAMRDLEIRGAGNLLGAEQHGHLDAVGYDLYIKLLNEAVLEERGETPPPMYESKIVFSEDAFLPEKYIKSSAQRMEMYKKIAHIQNEDDLCDMENELRDRFGRLPIPAKNLLSVAIIKSYAQSARLKRVEQLKGEIRLFPEDVNLGVLLEISKFDRSTVSICGVGKTPYICVKYTPDEGYVERTLRVIKLYIQKSNELV